VAHLVFSSTALAFLANMSEKHKSASPSAIHRKHRSKTINIAEKLCIIMRHEKDERIVDIRHNVSLAHDIVDKIRDNGDKIKESAKSGTKEFV
jgi:hypothetical protein